ncbi:MAG: FR47-like family protein [Herbaspirillum sp.]|nr:FR47-like family protein [Herbaspirillum sp.]
MSAMVDLNKTLASFQDALRNGLISPGSCTLHPEIKLLLDDVNGQPRLTYARIDEGEVRAIVIYVVVEPYKGVMCFQVGYAVVEAFRNQGIASEFFKQSLAELRHNSKKHTKSFYLEAVVASDNAASRKVAERVLGPSTMEIPDVYSGQPSIQFMRLIKC